MAEEIEYWTEASFVEAKKKMAELELELARVRQDKGEAAYGGDTWHDNFAFEEASRQEDILQRQIYELKSRLTKAQLVDKQPESHSVQIGSRVEIEFDDGDVSSYLIQDSISANPSKGIISYNSPIGSAVLNAQVGDIREYKVNEKVFRIKIVSIS